MPKLKRDRAGMYRTEDGRFSVEQSSGRWMVVDGEQADDLGLPLVRGPYDTLEEARIAIDSARSGPPPQSHLAGRAAAKGRAAVNGRADRDSKSSRATPSRRAAAKPSPLQVRGLRPGDGPALRDLWHEAGFRERDDDGDTALAALARRNPGLALVAVQGGEIVGSALGAWDGRHGWIYHLATAPAQRRSGIASRLVRDVESRLRDLGCRDVNVNVGDERQEARKLWKALGYVRIRTERLGKPL